MITGILLAAGQSSRFGMNKLIQLLADGTPMVCAAARNLAAGTDQVIAVVCPGPSATRDLLEQERVQVIECAAARSGMGHSIACGVRTSKDATGWLITLGDMPFIQPETIKRTGLLLSSGNIIAAPEYNGKRGHPVGFGRGYFDALAALSGDRGAREIIASHGSDLNVFACNDPGILMDIDTRMDFMQSLIHIRTAAN